MKQFVILLVAVFAVACMAAESHAQCGGGYSSGRSFYGGGFNSYGGGFGRSVYRGGFNRGFGGYGGYGGGFGRRGFGFRFY